MANIKKIIINTNECFLCGLCEDRQLGDVFDRGKDGKIHVLNDGLFDMDERPEIMELINLCPGEALSIEEEKVLTGSKANVIVQLNDLIYRELRDYPFKVPDSREYEYETRVYKASPIPVCSRSSRSYRDDDKAEDAGVSEFKSAVWSQAKSVAMQYITAYKVKKLRKYFTNEEKQGSYYIQKNQEIHDLLSKAYQLAMLATDNKISLPKDFCDFNVVLDWNEDGKFYLDSYNWIEDFHYDFERSSWFHDADYYRTYVNVDGDDRYYYDLTEAEAVFRDDMDYVVDSVIQGVAKDRVDSVTQAYFAKAKKILDEKLDILQNELKAHIKIDAKETFIAEIQSVYQKIKDADMPKISSPWPKIDLDYNSDYRFYSERSCEEAARNRRERAYGDGRHFVRCLPDTLNEKCMEKLQVMLTDWKRLVLQAYDISGIRHPQKNLCVSVGNSTVCIPLNDFNEVESLWDDEIKIFIDREILEYGTSVGEVEYISEYDIKIDIGHDYDLRDTLFGGLKEVNNRWCYHLWNIHDVRFSANDVGDACVKKLEESTYFKRYVESIKKSFIEEISKISGVKDI